MARSGKGARDGIPDTGYHRTFEGGKVKTFTAIERGRVDLGGVEGGRAAAGRRGRRSRRASRTTTRRRSSGPSSRSGAAAAALRRRRRRLEGGRDDQVLAQGHRVGLHVDGAPGVWALRRPRGRRPLDCGVIGQWDFDPAAMKVTCVNGLTPGTCVHSFGFDMKHKETGKEAPRDRGPDRVGLRQGRMCRYGKCYWGLNEGDRRDDAGGRRREGRCRVAHPGGDEGGGGRASRDGRDDQHRLYRAEGRRRPRATS